MAARELDGLNYEEIAAMDCPVGSAIHAIFRAQK